MPLIRAHRPIYVGEETKFFDGRIRALIDLAGPRCLFAAQFGRGSTEQPLFATPGAVVGFNNTYSTNGRSVLTLGSGLGVTSTATNAYSILYGVTLDTVSEAGLIAFGSGADGIATGIGHSDGTDFPTPGNNVIALKGGLTWVHPGGSGGFGSGALGGPNYLNISTLFTNSAWDASHTYWTVEGTVYGNDGNTTDTLAASTSSTAPASPTPGFKLAYALLYHDDVSIQLWQFAALLASVLMPLQAGAPLLHSNLRRARYFLPAAAGSAATGSTAFAGSAAFTPVGRKLAKASLIAAGSGSATFVARSLAKTSSSLAGSSSWSIVGKTLFKGSVAFSGSGALGGVAAALAKAVATYNGVGTFAPVGSKLAKATFSPAGVGSTTFTAKELARATFSAAGVGSFAPVRQSTAGTGVAGFSGSGALLAIGRLPVIGSASIAGVGAITFAAKSLARGQVGFAGAGTFTGIRLQSFTAFTGSGAATFTAAALAKAAWNPQGHGSLTHNVPVMPSGGHGKRAYAYLNDQQDIDDLAEICAMHFRKAA